MTVVDDVVGDHLTDDGPAPDDRAVAPAGGRGPRRVRGWRSLVAGALGYLALSVALWWQVWSTHPTAVTTCGCGDTSLFTWFLAWPAFALRHGMDPLYSTYLFHPAGVNLLTNTAEIGFGILLAPVTWAFGPIATLNVALTLSPALSALAMYVLLRRWVSWAPAAFAGGLLYGFSPFVVVSLTDAHLMLGMAAVPPLIVLCLDELLARQRWRWWATGLAIGGLAFAQFFFGTELLVLTAIAAGIGAILVVAGAALVRRRALAARARYALKAAAAALVSSAVLLAWPAWFALDGPAHLSGSIWGTPVLSYGGTSVRWFVHPMPALGRVLTLSHQVGGYQAPSLSGQYLGIGLLAVLLVGLVVWHRDVRLWLLAAVGVVSACFSVGLAFHHWTPWRLLVRLPLMENVIPSRFVLVVYLAAAAMLGIIVDHVARAAAGRPARRPGRAALGRVAGLAVAAVALVPIVAYFADGLPLTAVPVELPDWFTTVAPELPPHQVLLVLPSAFRQSNMTWQAVDGMRYAMVGGGGPDSLLSRAGAEEVGDRYLSQLSYTNGSQDLVAGEVAAVRRALDGWGVTGIVLPDPKGLPDYERMHAVRSAVVLLTAATGQLPEYRAHAWVWTGVDRAPPALGPPVSRLAECSAGSTDGPVASIRASATCILAAPSGA
jgi:hypothetical protein